MSADVLLLVVGTGFLALAACWVARQSLSRDAKLGRRRRRNNSPIRSKVNRPMVRLSVRTKRRK